MTLRGCMDQQADFSAALEKQLPQSPVMHRPSRQVRRAACGFSTKYVVAVSSAPAFHNVLIGISTDPIDTPSHTATTSVATDTM